MATLKDLYEMGIEYPTLVYNGFLFQVYRSVDIEDGDPLGLGNNENEAINKAVHNVLEMMENREQCAHNRKEQAIREYVEADKKLQAAREVYTRWGS